MNFYKHHIGDYDADTAHLSWLEDAAYRRLMCLYYRREQPIPADIGQACRLVRAVSKQEREAVESVLREFFVLTDDGWRNKRCEEDLAAADELNVEREQRAENERERQRRHREERKAIFLALRERGIVPPWDTKTEALRVLLGNAPVTPPVTVTGALSVTPVTGSATANQTPDARHQTPEEEKTSTFGACPPQAPDDQAEPVAKPRNAPPPCPYQAIADAYHEALPQLPRLAVLSEGRKRTLQARWREVCAEDGITDADAGLRVFRDFFRHVATSPFLMGQGNPDRDGRVWRADFDWLMAPRNFVRVVEGRYHGKKAA